MEQVFKLKVKNTQMAGKFLILPLVGEKRISEEGILELENEEVFNALAKNTEAYEIIGKKSAAKEEKTSTDVNFDEAVEDVSEEEFKPENEEEETALSAADLNKMTIEELKEMLKESGFEEDQYKHAKSKKLLISFILKNLK